MVQHGALHFALVDERSAHRAEVPDEKPSLVMLDGGVLRGHLRVVDPEAAGLAAADRHGLDRHGDSLAPPGTVQDDQSENQCNSGPAPSGHRPRS